MEQKDYILREIEKIGTMIQYLLGKLNRREIKEEVFTTEETDRAFISETGISMDDLSRIPPEAFDTFFSEKKGYNAANTELLADLFYQVSLQVGEKSLRYQQQALALYQYLDRHNHTYSFTRAKKIEHLRSLLSKSEE